MSVVSAESTTAENFDSAAALTTMPKQLVPKQPPKVAYSGPEAAVPRGTDKSFIRHRHTGGVNHQSEEGLSPTDIIDVSSASLVPSPPPPKPRPEDISDPIHDTTSNSDDPLAFLANAQELAYRELLNKEQHMAFEVISGQGWFEGAILRIREEEGKSRCDHIQKDEDLRRQALVEGCTYGAWKVSLLTGRKSVVSEEEGTRTRLLAEEAEGWHSLTAAVVGRYYYWLFGREARARIRLTMEYFKMLMEFCEALEILHRRDLIHRIVPLANIAVASTERRSWLAARRNEMARRDFEYQKGEEADMKRRQKYFEWTLSLLQSRTNIEKAEAASRVVNVYTKERKAFQSIVDLANIEYPVLLRRQLKEQAHFARLNTIVEWTPQTYERVCLGEASGRNDVTAAQKEVWHRIMADEAREYLTARREELVNAEMHKIMAAYDARAATTVTSSTAVKS